MFPRAGLSAIRSNVCSRNDAVEQYALRKVQIMRVTGQLFIASHGSWIDTANHLLSAVMVLVTLPGL